MTPPPLGFASLFSVTARKVGGTRGTCEMTAIVNALYDEIYDSIRPVANLQKGLNIDTGTT